MGANRLPATAAGATAAGATTAAAVATATGATTAAVAAATRTTTAAAVAAATGATTAAAVAAAGTTAAATAAFAAGSGFVHREGAAVKLRTVLVADRGLELVGVHIHETETTAFDDAGAGRAIRRERCEKGLLRAGVRQIANV